MVTDLGATSLVGVILESVNYGIYLVLFFYGLYLQSRHYKDKAADTSKSNHVLYAASTLLFLMISCRWAINVARLFEAVIILERVVPMSMYFANIADDKQIAVTALFAGEILVGDFILIYRLLHIYRPNFYVCILPALSWICVAIGSGFILHAMAHAPLSRGVFQHNVQTWFTVFFSCTIATNVYCTGMIGLRLWKAHHSHLEMAHSYVVRSLQIFVESAALLTICLVAVLVAFLVRSQVQYAILDMTSPALGISFTLILLRVNMQRNDIGGSSKDVESLERWRLSPFPPLSSNIQIPPPTEVKRVCRTPTSPNKPFSIE